METRRRKQERIFANVRRVPGIGAEISQYLPEVRDRSQLSEQKNRGGGGGGDGFLVFPEDKDKICLPTNVFRTNPEPHGCAPFTEPENEGSCCVQSNLEFCASVSAILRGKEEYRPSAGRITKEMYAWLKTIRSDLLPDDKEVHIGTSTNDGKQLLDLAVNMSTDVSIHLALFQPNQTRRDDISELRGVVRVHAGANGATMNFASLMDIVQSQSNLRRLIVDCGIDIPNTANEHGVTDAINDTQSWNSDTNFEYELQLPQRIPVLSVGHELVNLGWVTRQPPNGPIRSVSGEIVAVTYDVQQNRIFVHVQE